MKKLIACAFVFATVFANAQTLEERVEALEFKSYENFFKVSGSLEMRYDFVDRKNNGDAYTVINDTGAYGASLQNAIAVGLGTGLPGGDANTIQQTIGGQFAAAGCGQAIGTTGVTKDGCTTVAEDQSDNSRYGRMFFNLDFESTPSDKLTFYGRLSMAKYVSEISRTGSGSRTDAFGDLAAGATAGDASVWVERAFANYKMTDDLTFTFGRLPTIDGAPKHHHNNTPMAGSYPILAFSAIFDGMALTQTFGNHLVRVIYSPLSTPNFRDNITRQNNESGDRLDRMIDTFAFMYEYQNNQVSFAKNFHFIFTDNNGTNMPFAGTDLELSFNRMSWYAEAVGVADSNFDLIVHGVSTTTKSRGVLNSKAPGLGAEVPTLTTRADGTWLGIKDEGGESTGSAFGLLVKYNFRTKSWLKNSIIGVEHFQGEEGAFLYDSANLDPVAMYATYGTAQRLFFAKDFDGGLKWNLQYMTQQSDYQYPLSGLIGTAQEIDRTTSFVSSSFTAYF